MQWPTSLHAARDQSERSEQFASGMGLVGWQDRDPVMAVVLWGDGSVLWSVVRRSMAVVVLSRGECPRLWYEDVE